MTTVSIDLRTKDVMLSCDICQDVTITSAMPTSDEVDQAVDNYKAEHKH